MAEPADACGYARAAFGHNPGTKSRRHVILDAATSKYPDVAGLWYLNGLAHEQNGNTIQSMDRYFYEAKALPESMYKDEAQYRLSGAAIALMKRSRKAETSAPARFLDAYGWSSIAFQFLRSQGVRKETLEVAANCWREAATVFGKIASETDIFAAQYMQAETDFFARLALAEPLEPSKMLFVTAVEKRPGFGPAYSHLVHIADCHRNDAEMKEWVIRAIRRNPFQTHPMIEKALGIVEHGGDRGEGRNSCVFQ